jgi:heat shock protein 5
MFAPIETVLEDAEMTISDVDDVIIIGGTCKMPKIRSMLSDYLQKPPLHGADPLEAVARGAALAAYCIKASQQTAGAPGRGVLGAVLPSIGELNWVETCTFPIGVARLGGVMSVIIERGASLPAVRRTSYFTTAHNQTSILFVIYEGAWKVASSNKKLGEFTVADIPPAEANEQEIEVEFRLGLDGILNVKAWVASDPANPVNLRVSKASHLFSGERVKALSTERRKAHEDDEQQADECGRKAVVAQLSENLRDFLSRSNIGTAADRTTLQGIIDRLVPRSLMKPPTWDEISAAIQELKNAPSMARYFRVERGRFPQWLS